MTRLRRVTQLILGSLFLLAARPLWATVEMSSWMSYQIQHQETLDQYGQNFTSICVFAYDFDTSDNLRPAQPWVDSTLDNLMSNKKPGRPVFITIVNDVESDPPLQHNGDIVLRVLSDPAKRAEHIRQIVALSARADGIDIDYESLLEGTRPHFTQFIKELRAALPSGKLLSVVCQPKTDDEDGPRGQAIDWRAIAPNVDILKAMTYYYAYGGSEPGPSAPLDKVHDVTALAVKEVPPEKLQVVLTQFGWDWPAGGVGQFLTYGDAMQLAQQHGVTPFRDPESQTMRINYTDDSGVAHQVWFDDSTALLARINMIQSLGVNKIDVWELGVGDPAFWTWVSQNTTNPNGGSSGGPTVSSISPISAAVGSPAIRLTLTGTNFVNGSVAQWSGANRTTTFISATTLLVDIPASDLSAPGFATLTVVNPSPNDGTSSGQTFNIIGANPTPVLTGLSPSSKKAGGPGFTLIVVGSGFVNGSVVQWNGNSRQTTFVSATQLNAAITAADIANVGTSAVSVVSPSPGGGTSNSQSFQATDQSVLQNPVPIITSLNPSSAIAGDIKGPFILTVVGFNFIPTSVIQWNGKDMPTNSLNGTTLTTEIPAEDLATVNSATVTVFNPTPGGGTSAGFTFATLAPPSPPPVISELIPPSVPADTPDFTLTIHGENFTQDSAIQWNGAVMPTTFVDPTQLQAVISADVIDSPGTALITVIGAGQETSSPQKFVVAAPSVATQDLSQARVFPNPWVISKHKGALITFDRLTQDATVKLFTMSGRWVKSIETSQGRGTWDLTNDAGEPVASDYYIYLITDSAGHKAKGKVAVVK